MKTRRGGTTRDTRLGPRGAEASKQVRRVAEASQDAARMKDAAPQRARGRRVSRSGLWAN